MEPRSRSAARSSSAISPSAAMTQAVGKAVTFWGAQWWKLNSLSGGDGPAEFKGFENSPAMPTCGDNWTTRPGNSTPPPDTIPAYMAIVVSSQIKNTGSSIGGDTTIS